MTRKQFRTVGLLLLWVLLFVALLAHGTVSLGFLYAGFVLTQVLLGAQIRWHWKK